MFSIISTKTTASFDLTEDAKTAYRLAIELRLDEASALCQSMKVGDPDNLIPYYIENYIDFFTILINEDYDEFKRLEKVKKERIKKVKSGDANSPYYRLILGEIHLLSSIARLKFDEKLRALQDANSAYRYLTENQQIFPEFLPTKKSLSMIHAMAESIPGIFKFFLSIEGSIEQGTAEIKEVVEYGDKHDFLFHEEAIAVYTYILYAQNNKPEEAWNILNSSTKLKQLNSPLSSFIYAFFAQKTGRNDEAIEFLRNRPQGQEYRSFHYLDFMLGKSLLYKLDAEAIEYINAYVTNFKGKHYFKEAYQKLAWYELVIRDNLAGYKHNMALCQKVGQRLVDSDKQALKEAKSGKIPHPVLVKARLLFDGGYFQKAQSILIKNALLFPLNNDHELEFTYRSGRIAHALKNYIDALHFYSETLEKGEYSRSYFVCNAALQMGLIYEDQQQFEMAKKFFRKCLSLDPDDYRNSLHQKAKSGLERLK